MVGNVFPTGRQRVEPQLSTPTCAHTLPLQFFFRPRGWTATVSLHSGWPCSGPWCHSWCPLAPAESLSEWPRLHLVRLDYNHNLSRCRRLRQSLQPHLPERRARKYMQRALQKAFSQQPENIAHYRSALTLAPHCHLVPEQTKWLKHSVRLLPATSMQGVVTFGCPPP